QSLALWLVANPPVKRGDMSMTRYRPADETWSLGVVRAAVNGQPVDAMLAPDDSRIVIDSRAAIVSRLHTFPASNGSRDVLAVADSLSIGWR
ncbi:MAG: hypothetical protein H7Z38_02065, partial [Rubrivivax sp.]|nr:hypothetical protein [Pyrinomonadaceae bacterium]